MRRREFMGLTAAGIAGGVTPPWHRATTAPAAPPGTDPDLVVLNATVYTVDATAPRAQAFAVKAGRVVAVGSTTEITALTGRSTQRFDTRGMTVVPGFIDCHNHPVGTTLLYEVLGLRPQLLHQRALGAAEGSPKHLVPRLPHEFEEGRHVPVGEGLLGDGLVVAQVAPRRIGGLGLVEVGELALDEGCEPRPEQFHRLADTFLVGDGHGFGLRLSFSLRPVPRGATRRRAASRSLTRRPARARRGRAPTAAASRADARSPPR